MKISNEGLLLRLLVIATLAAILAFSSKGAESPDEFATKLNGKLPRRSVEGGTRKTAAPGSEATGVAAEVSTKLSEVLSRMTAINQAKPVAPKAQGRQAIRAQSGVADEAEVTLRPVNGTVLQIKGKILEQPAAGKLFASAGSRNEHTARQFLRRNAGLLRVQDPDAELNLASQEGDGLGKHLRFNQSYRGLPVWPAGLRVHLDPAGNVNLLDGSYAPTPAGVAVEPKVTADEAIERAKALLKNSAQAEATQPELIIYASLQAPPRLAWRFDLSVRLTEAWLFVVDALNGRILHRSTRIHDANVVGAGVDQTGTTRALNVWQQEGTYFLSDTSKKMFDGGFDPLQDPHGVITVTDARGRSVEEVWGNPVFLITSSQHNLWDIPAGVSAAFNFSQTYDYYLERHGRNSLDGNGGNVTAIVRVGGYANASWHGNLRVMLFGDVKAYAASLDVVGHELTHGVTENTAGLIYENQSGALNESMSDIFGEMVEARARGQNDWLIGSELDKPIRNMKNPGAIIIGNTGRGFPSKMSEFLNMDNTPDTDHGGVHFNSSIINHAFYLLAEGLPEAIGRGDAERIFFRNLTQHLQAQSQFIDCRLGCVASAEELFGANSTQARATAAAFDAVEIFAAPTTPDPTPVPVVQGPDSALFVYFDDVFGTYGLGRREGALGDNEFGSAFADDVRASRPAVTGDGTIALFVNSEWDICIAQTDDGTTRQCLGFAGTVHSVAVSPNGKLAAFVLRNPQTEQPDGKITVVDIEAGSAKTYNLVAPSEDGIAIDAILYADAMTFSTDSSMIVYDALSQVKIGNNPAVERWSIYSLNLATEKTSIIVPPIDGYDTGNPSYGRAGNRYIVFDAIQAGSGNTAVLVLDLFSGQAAAVGVVQNGVGYPAFTGDEGGVIFAARDENATATGFSLFKQELGSDRLTKNGTPTLWYQDAELGVIYRRGAFSGTNSLPTITLTATPSNPTAPAVLILTATAGDNGGQVAKVEFYNGTTKLGEVTAAPYKFTWRGVARGEYHLIARAIDNVQGTTDSEPVHVTVGDGQGGGGSHVRVQRLANQAMRLTIESTAGDYIIQQTTNFRDWVDIYPVTVGNDGKGSVDDFGGPQNNAILFYRTKKSE
jgi:bacillolysin